MARLFTVCVAMLALATVTTGYQTCTIKDSTVITPFKTYDSSPYRLAMPCRYQLVDFEVEVPQVNKICAPRIFATGIRIGGLFYVNSFDVRLSFYDTSDPNTLLNYVAVKAFGKIKNGEFQMTTLVRHTVFEGGDVWRKSEDVSPIEQVFPGTQYDFNNTDGDVLFYVEACKLAINFVHVKMDLSNVDSAVLEVKIPNADEVTTYYDVEHSACIKTCVSGCLMASLMGANSVTDAMTYNMAGHWRKNPGHTYADLEQCTAMQIMVQHCPAVRRPAALQACMFMLTDENYLSCASTEVDSSDAINLFNQCVLGLCFLNGCEDRALAPNCPVPELEYCSI